MAPVVAAAALLYSGYEAVAGNQRTQDAKGQANTLLDTQAKQTANAQAASNAAASTAAAVQKKRAIAASGQSGTILTSPQGAPAAPTARKTLIGLVVLLAVLPMVR